LRDDQAADVGEVDVDDGGGEALAGADAVERVGPRKAVAVS
jgi:hypothetical protein